MSIWRSALSILGAFFVVAVLIGLATALASNLMLGGRGPGVQVAPAYLVVNPVYIAVIGGYVAATVSDHLPLGHAAGLTGFMMVLGLASWLVVNRGDPVTGQPFWYPLVIGILVPPSAILGGILVTRRTQGTHVSGRALVPGAEPERIEPRLHLNRRPHSSRSRHRCVSTPFR